MRARYVGIRRFALALIALSPISCVNQVAEPLSLARQAELDDEHAAAFAGEGEDLIARLIDDEPGWKRTPALPIDETANRAAFRFDAIEAPAVQARTSEDGGETYGAWQDAVVTYVDAVAHNAHADLPAGATHVELRFQEPERAGLSFVAIELLEVVPQSEEQDEGLAIAEPEASEQGLAADGVVVTRAQWGARPRSCSGSHTPQRMTIHHTVTPNNDSMSMPARMRQIQAFHIDQRGWCDIGYHFLIGQDGQVYQGRLENKIGAHAANANSNNVGISFIGTFTGPAPSAGMMSAAGRIMKRLSVVYGIPLNRTYVKGHRQVGTTSTSCPGDALYARLQNLIDVALGTSGGGGGGGGGFCAPSKTGTWCDGSQLVVCASGAQVSRSTCGHGCQIMPPGVPDQCKAPPPPAPTGFCATHGGTWCDGNDVVVCSDQREVSRTHCAYGCQSMPSGTPDQCAAPPPQAPSSTYEDVPASHWAHGAVEKMRDLGALYGCAAGRFCPDEPISRGLLAHAIAKVDQRAYSGGPSFSDVPSNHPYAAMIREVAAKGIITGCASGGFCPDGSVSRAAAAVFMRRARDLPNHTPATPSYVDVASSHWAYGAIERMRAANVFYGCRSNPLSYCPSDDLTRAQAAVILVRAYGL